MYLSGMGCTSSDCQDGIAYIENPGLVSDRHNAASSFGTSSILSRYPISFPLLLSPFYSTDFILTGSIFVPFLSYATVCFAEM